jgi:hypothetical protein
MGMSCLRFSIPTAVKAGYTPRPPVDGDDAVFGLHLDDDFVEEILVLLQHFGDPGEGEDGRDGSHAQAALAALMPRRFQFHGSSSSMRAGS